MPLRESDQLFVSELAGGDFRLSPYDPALAADMAAGESIATRYRSTLRKLAE